MKNYIYIETAIGILGIAEDGIGITDLVFGRKSFEADDIEGETPLLKKVKEQLQEYFMGKRKEFDLPLSLYGTEFQIKDWNALKEIPYGETRTYGQIAQQIGNPKACRAVGLANNRNPVSIIIPCHRVIGANGRLVGYGGGLDVKEKLLALEKSNK